MITASTHGAPNWVDLATPDVAGAVGFYRELFGWTIEKTTSPMGDYYIGKVGEQQVGGMMGLDLDQAETPPMWTTFFNVGDVDEMVTRVTAAGGSLLEAPFDIGQARIAIVADPAGAMFGLFAGPELFVGSAEEATWLTTESGGVCWVETMNRDPAAAEVFYATVFEWNTETRLTVARAYTTFRLGDDPVAGMMMMPDEIGPEIPAHWGVYFAVSSCLDTEEEAVRLGGRVLRPAQRIEMGHFSVIADAQGAVFQVMDFVE